MVRIRTSYAVHCSLTSFVFTEGYWSTLNPEKAFLARVFVEHCKNIKDYAKLENALPVVTLIAFRIQEAYNHLIENITSQDGHAEDLDNEETDRREDERIARELVISELLKLAVNLDYSDEIGRRKTFQLVRASLPPLYCILPSCARRRRYVEG